MRLSKIKILFPILCLVFINSSCVDYLQDLNYDQKRITDELLSIDANDGGFSLPGMQLAIIDATGSQSHYEKQQYLNANNYVGYNGYPVSVYDNRNNMTYVMVDDWNNWVWRVPATKVFDQWVSMKKKGYDVKYPDLFAIATLFKVFSGHRLTDALGPIPYRLYGTSSEVSFDSMEETYNLFFVELKEVVDALQQAEDANPTADQVRYAKFDRSRFGGDYAKWIRVANTLRLRLAIRISNVSPEKAKLEAEAAVLSKGGLLTASDLPFEVKPGSVHPLYTITESWGEASINALLTSYLLGYNDPRLPIYAKPATHPLFKDQYVGVRSGASYDMGPFIEYSKPNVSTTQYVKVMDVAESYFLRAEGALKGWNMGGTAKDFYELGVAASFKTHGVTGVELYLDNEKATQLDYVDPVNPDNSAKAISTITVKWDESAPDPVKLEKIITQKWIALYPDGMESWSEFRRTGYPKLWPVVRNYSRGEVPEGEFIKRIPYPTIVTNASRKSVDEAVNKYLGGKDSMFSPLWWDVD